MAPEVSRRSGIGRVSTAWRRWRIGSGSPWMNVRGWAIGSPRQTLTRRMEEMSGDTHVDQEWILIHGVVDDRHLSKTTPAGSFGGGRLRRAKKGFRVLI